MFDRIKRIGNKRLPVSVVVSVLALFLMAGALIAATGSATVDHQARTLWAKFIKPVRVSGTAYNWLQIGENSASHREISGVTLVGNLYKSGVTETPAKKYRATVGGYLSGTSTIAMTAATAASTGNGAGSSGFYLNTGHLQQYAAFLVDATAAGISKYGSPKGISLAANTGGATIYLTGLLTADVDGMSWDFTNLGGTTAFVLFDGNGRFNGGTGVTENQTTTARAPEDKGDSIRIRAVFTPTAVSGWYVENIWNAD